MKWSSSGFYFLNDLQSAIVLFVLQFSEWTHHLWTRSGNHSSLLKKELWLFETSTGRHQEYMNDPSKTLTFKITICQHSISLVCPPQKLPKHITHVLYHIQQIHARKETKRSEYLRKNKDVSTSKQKNLDTLALRNQKPFIYWKFTNYKKKQK